MTLLTLLGGAFGTPPTYSINAGSEIHGVLSSWRRLQKRGKTTGEIVFTNIAVNRWQMPLMDMTTFEALRTAQGSEIASLETNDIDKRNVLKSYTAPLVSLISGSQVGINMTNVTIEFWVDVS